MKIKVEVKDVTHQMFLRNVIAEGETDDGRKLEVTSVVPDGSLHFRIGDKSYLLAMRDVLNAILEKA